MSQILSTRKIVTQFEGDVTVDFTTTATNLDSPGKLDVVTLDEGPNTITVPTGGTTPVAVTIIPPVANTNTLILKGSSGDDGIALHLTQPCSISLANDVTDFVLDAGGSIVGLQLIWY